MIPFSLDPNHPREFVPIAKAVIPFFAEMFESLGELERAGRQRSWLSTLGESKVTILFFFSPGCEACHCVAPLVRETAAGCEAKGLTLLGISEYAAPAETEAYRALHKHRFSFVYESMHRDARDNEDLWHQQVRRELKDRREWGLPLFLFRVRGGDLFSCLGEPRPEELLDFLSGPLA